MAIPRIIRRGERADRFPQGGPCSGMGEPSGVPAFFRLQDNA